MGNKKSKKRKKMNSSFSKFNRFDAHLQMYILLASILFTSLGLVHFTFIIKKVLISINGVTLPMYFSYMVLAVSFFMVLMGHYYYKALRK